jgi:recombination protein RecA
MGRLARVELESLLQARKLDVTLTSAAPWRLAAEDRTAPTGVATLDAALGGGLRRGHLSEIVGPRSTGRTALMCRLLAAAQSRGEIVAIIDTHDRFDPASAAETGLQLSKLLWIRDAGDAGRAMKAMNLVLQAGGFGIVALDISDARRTETRQFPFTTWLRLARVIEGSETVAVIVAAERLGRSPGGVTIALDVAEAGMRGRWTGTADRARLLRGIDLQPRVVAARM